jgi:hypothetical protein
MPRIDAFVFDDRNEEKIWSHGLTPERVLEILDFPIAIKPNRKGQSAPLLLIGRDYSGQCIAIPVFPTHESGVWRPATAWPCKPSEWNSLPKSK